MTDFRTVDALQQALDDISTFEKGLEKYIKDEKEAQELYVGAAKDALKLIRMNSVFLQMYNEISGIYRDEARHEGMFTRMLRETQKAKKMLEMELEQKVARALYPVEMGFPGAQVKGRLGVKGR